jgi:hypothetical protein
MKNHVCNVLGLELQHFFVIALSMGPNMEVGGIDGIIIRLG